MSTRHDIQGWLSHNEVRNYPFKENMPCVPTRESTGATVAPIPTGVLIDLGISTPFSLLEELVPGVVFTHLPPAFKLRAFVKTLSSVTFVFSEVFPGSVTEVDIAEVEVPLGSLFVPRKPYKVTSLVPATHGIAVFGKDFLTYFGSLVIGTYLLDDSNGVLQERTVRDNPFARVTSISELGNTLQLLVGDVKLEEGHNIQLTPVVEKNGIRIDAFPGAGAGVYCGRGCAGTFPDTVLVPNGDVWKYKVYKDGTVPAPSAAFYRAVGGSVRGGAPLDYFEETHDDLLWEEAAMPYRRGMGSSQPPVGLHIFEESTEIAVRKWIELPDDISGLMVVVTLGWDDYVEAYWNEVPITPLINSGGAKLCVPYAPAAKGG